MKEMAVAWASAAPHAKQSYLASFALSRNVKDDLFFCAFLALGVYLATLAAGILAGRDYARWIGRAAAVSAVLVLAGDLLELVFDPAFVAVLVGFALFLVVVIALGASMWRRASASERTTRPARPSGATGGSWSPTRHEGVPR
jgi:membrane protein implicated in regulation of membrane protease activity